MEKQQTVLLVITVLVAVSAVCSVYSAYLQTQDSPDSTYDALKEKVNDINTYGGRIYYNGSYIEKSVNVTFYPEDNYVRAVASSSTFHIPYYSISAVMVNNH